jgi:ribosomal protein S18 acetylase RimI-like enzyme
LSDCAFLYDIEVEPAHRGAGYGRALLALGEDAVRGHGLAAIELNVFGGNARALRLYESSGYRVITQQLRKTLAADPCQDPSRTAPGPGVPGASRGRDGG